jgi:catechol 2,3-dioxygenase-like lactoylglutathione lyase family enzyme
MSRIQLALNVSDLDAAVDFYSRYFDATPAKVRPGYANFAIEEPPLKLVLIQGAGDPGSINHLGVEVFSTDDVAAKAAYLATSGFEVEVEDATTCCHAVQDKVWVAGPDDTSWETYVVLEDADASTSGDGEGTSCCATSSPSSAPARCC